MKSIDVIVPCYNYGRFLASCVASIVSQTGCRTRALVIDDASTDATSVIARRLAGKHPQVEVISHSMNRGHIATYNEGIDRVSSDYLLLLSADDLLAQGALARSISLLEANPCLSFVYGRAVRFTGNDAPTAIAASEPSGVRIQSGRDFIRALCENPVNPVETATAVVRTSVQKQVGGYRPDLPHAGDYEMWLRLAAHGDIGNIEAVQAFTRMHGENMRNGYMANQMLGDLAQRHAAFRSFFATEGSRVVDGPALQARANRRLAEEALWEASRAFELGTKANFTCLRALAREICPAIGGSCQWRKLAAKRLVGRNTWLALEPVVRHIRQPHSRARRIAG